MSSPTNAVRDISTLSNHVQNTLNNLHKEHCD